jgi:hypothetical protein
MVSVSCDGIYRNHAGGQQTPFKLRMQFATPVMHVASINVTTSRLGELDGKVFFIGGGGSFIARSESAAISAHVSISERRVISLTGAVEIDRRYFGYSLKGTIASNRAALSNVVRVSNARRA